MKNTDDIYLKKALDLAKKAGLNGGVPVGSIIVKNKKIISTAYNEREKNGVVTHHAEILAVERASKKIMDWRLDKCILYTSLKPCAMCIEVIKEARIKEVIYAASEKRENKNKEIIKIRKTKNKKIEIESARMLKEFFLSVR